MKYILFCKLSLLFVVACFFITSCAPVAFSQKIEYLGDSYSPTDSLDVFYEAKQIKREYRVMGRMLRETANKSEKGRKNMIELAKSKGADAILFFDFESKTNETSGYSVLKAELIKYQ